MDLAFWRGFAEEVLLFDLFPPSGPTFSRCVSLVLWHAHRPTVVILVGPSTPVITPLAFPLGFAGFSPPDLGVSAASILV